MQRFSRNGEPSLLVKIKTCDQIIPLESIDTLTLGKLRPVKKPGVKGYLSNIQLDSGLKPVFETPEFFSQAGVFTDETKQSGADDQGGHKQTTTGYNLFLSRTNTDFWLNNFQMKLRSHLFKLLISRISEFNNTSVKQGQTCPMIFNDLLKEAVFEKDKIDQAIVDKYLKNTYHEYGGQYLKILPEALVFKNLKSGVLIGQTIKELASQHSLPKNGIYKIRLVPSYVYIGK